MGCPRRRRLGEWDIGGDIGCAVLPLCHLLRMVAKAAPAPFRSIQPNEEASTCFELPAAWELSEPRSKVHDRKYRHPVKRRLYVVLCLTERKPSSSRSPRRYILPPDQPPSPSLLLSDFSTTLVPRRVLRERNCWRLHKQASEAVPASHLTSEVLNLIS